MFLIVEGSSSKQDLINVLPCQDIFLSKVYKSLATRKKRGHSKTIKQSLNSPSKVISTALAVLFTLVDSGIDVLVCTSMYPGYRFDCSKLFNRFERINQW